MNKEMVGAALSSLRKVSFWMLLLIITAIELVVVNPFGGILSAIVLAYWLIAGDNGARLIKKIAGSVGSRKPEAVENSLWYDCEGKEQIAKIIDDITDAGLSYCMLSDMLKLPPTSEWQYISGKLGDMGVKSQYSLSAHTFYISWRVIRD